MDENQGESRLINLKESSDITGFFYTAIQGAQKTLAIKLTENVEFYLVNLLCDFIRIEEHTAFAESFVHLMNKAVESMNAEKIVIYKKIADNALYFSGYYQEYFSNKSYSIKYYISMGRSAYQTLSSLMHEQTTYCKTMSKIYAEMSEHFLAAVDILLLVSEKTFHTKKSRSALNIYESWLDTESKKLEIDLLEKGIIPLRNTNKKVQ